MSTGLSSGCQRCGRDVPSWFLVPLEATGVFDTPGRTGDPIIIERSCFACQNDWPYPTQGQSEDDYVEQLRRSER